MQKKLSNAARLWRTFSAENTLGYSTRGGPTKASRAPYRGISPVTRVLLAALLFVTSVLTPRELAAQTNHPPRRYLLIIETSKAMDHRTSGLHQTLQKLLSSQLNGEALPVDSLGIWTFNEDLSTGKIRLQHFDPLDPTAMTTEVMAFMKKQKFEKNARWDPLLPALNHLVQNSHALTVILVTAGLENVQGTPFDARINKAFNSWREQQQTARMPVVTVLRARGGKLTDVAVSAPPWPVEFPKVQAEPQVAKKGEPTPPAKAAPQAPARPPPMAAPLIISGRKPQPVPVATNSIATAVLTNAAAGTAQSLVNATTPETLDTKNSPAGVAASTANVATPSSQLTAATAAPTPTQAQGVPATVTTPAETLASASSPSKAEPAAESAGSSSAQTSAPDTAAPLATAATKPAPNWLRMVWLVGGCCTVFALLGIFVAWKRSRPTGHLSSITRSLEQQPARTQQSSSVDAR